MPGFKDDAQHSGRLAGKVIGSLMAGAALVGCATTPEAKPVETTSQLPPTPDKPSTTASETPTASETQTSAEFTPGATGKYSPEALAAIADDPEALAKVFEITGDTPEEIAENDRKALIGYIMSGTDEADLAKYRDANGFVNIPNSVQYKNDMRDKYSGPACQGMNGRPCHFQQDIENLADIVRTMYAQNHMNGSSATGLPADFMLGADTILNVKVLKGSVGDGILQIQRDTLSTNNYDDSVAIAIVNNIKDIDKDAAAKYSSVQNWGGHRRDTTTYQKVGDHWNVVDSGETVFVG